MRVSDNLLILRDASAQAGLRLWVNLVVGKSVFQCLISEAGGLKRSSWSSRLRDFGPGACARLWSVVVQKTVKRVFGGV